MPYYFFNLDECGDRTLDEEGRQFAALNDARAYARVAARSVMASEVEQGRLCLSCHIVIANEAGTELARVLFREALTITGL